MHAKDVLPLSGGTGVVNEESEKEERSEKIMDLMRLKVAEVEHEEEEEEGEDRIIAAYAIVELGERHGSKNCSDGSDVQSTDVEDDLEAYDTDNYHQVPRSPECLHHSSSCRNHHHQQQQQHPQPSSMENSPVGSPMFAHVRGVVMPSRSSSNGLIPKLQRQQKRKLEDDVDGGIKGKLARMLFEKQFQRDLKSVNEKDDEQNENDHDEKAENSENETFCGKFVRTSMPSILLQFDASTQSEVIKDGEIVDQSKKLFEEDKINGSEEDGKNSEFYSLAKEKENQLQIQIQEDTTNQFSSSMISSPNHQCSNVLSAPSSVVKNFITNASLETLLSTVNVPSISVCLSELSSSEKFLRNDIPNYCSPGINSSNRNSPVVSRNQNESPKTDEEHQQFSNSSLSRLFEITNRLRPELINSSTSRPAMSTAAAVNGNTIDNNTNRNQSFQIVNIVVPGIGLMPMVVMPSKPQISTLPDLPLNNYESYEISKNDGGLVNRFRRNESPDGVSGREWRKDSHELIRSYGTAVDKRSRLDDAASELLTDGQSLPSAHFFQISKNCEPYRLFGSLNSISDYYSAGREAVGQFQNVSHSIGSQDFPKTSQCFAEFSSDYRNEKMNNRLEKFCNETKSTERVDNPLETYFNDRYGKCFLSIEDILKRMEGGEFGSLKTLSAYYKNLKSRKRIGMKHSKKTLLTRKLQSSGSSYMLPNLLSHSICEKTDIIQDLPLDLSSCRHEFKDNGETKWTADERKMISDEKKMISDERKMISDEKKMISEPSSQRTSVYNDMPVNKILEDTALRNCGVSSTICDRIIYFAAAGNQTQSSLSCASSRASTPLSATTMPNSHLPPKKRKLIELSESNNFSESERAFAVTSSVISPTSTSIESSMSHSSCMLQSAFIKSTINKKRSDDRETMITETGSSFLKGGRKTKSLKQEKMMASTALFTRHLHVAVKPDEDGDLPLHIAVAQGLQSVVEKLLHLMSQLEVSVDSFNNNRQTALHLAVISNQSCIVQSLLNASASPNVCDRKGNNAIHLAVKYQTLSCLNCLLSHSKFFVDINAKNYEGLTPLHLAVQSLQLEVVSSLLKNGADANVMDGTNGRTPLYYAVEVNDYVMATVLLNYGSNPCIQSYSGCTPLQIATAKSFRDLTHILEKNL